MAHLLTGNLCSRLCADCFDPLIDAKLRIYSAPQGTASKDAVAPTKETFVLLDDQDELASSKPLVEVDIDANGDFSADLGESYDWQPIRIDLVIDTVSGRPEHAERRLTQISLTTIEPRWREGSKDFKAAWRHCISARYWCAIRARYNAWVICGSLLTCDSKQPVRGATVTAFDADWIQDDTIGSAVTNHAGHFRIDYSTGDFRITPFSPSINFELVGGPDLYFKADIGGNEIYREDRAVGRTTARENSGPCSCVELCTKQVMGDPEQTPHWKRVESFDIYPKAPDPLADFSLEGFAGEDLIVFDDTVRLYGNCPLFNAAAPTNPLEYRFTIGEWTWPGEEDPSVPPPVPPSRFSPVTAVAGTTAGYIDYLDASGMSASQKVIVQATDRDGWIKIAGTEVTVPMNDGTMSAQVVSSSNFLRTFELIRMKTNPITSLHASKLGSLGGGVPSNESGRSLLPAELEPIRRYHLRFEVRDSVTKTMVYTDDLESIVLDNSPVIWGLNLEELLKDLCNPVVGLTDVHLLYTIDHPHLRWFKIEIANNAGIKHHAPPLPERSFSGDYHFRGSAGGPSNSSGTGGVAVDVSRDQPCSYNVKLSWQTRHLYDVATSRQVLYCK